MENLVKVKLNDGNAGRHSVILSSPTGPVSYGHRKNGEVFFVQEQHAKSHMFIVMEDQGAPPVEKKAPEKPVESLEDIRSSLETPEVQPRVEDPTLDDLNLQERHVNVLRDNGYTEVRQVALASVDDLVKIKGFGKVMAGKVKEMANGLLAG